MHTEAFQFNSFEVDDTPKKKARLSGGPVANPGEPEVEVEVETGLKHTRSDGDGAAKKKGKRSDGAMAMDLPLRMKPEEQEEADQQTILERSTLNICKVWHAHGHHNVS